MATNTSLPSTSGTTPRTGTQWFNAVITLIVGLVLIIFHNHIDLVTWIVEIMGWLIVLMSIYLVLSNVVRPKPQRNIWQIILGIIVLIPGIWIVASPGTFSQLIIYIFATVLMLYGLWHILTLRTAGRSIDVSWWLYFIPALLIVTGIAFFITGAKVVTTAILLIMGIALVLSAISTVAAIFGTRSNK